MEELIKEVTELREEIGEHCKPLDTFSDDKGKRALAGLRRKLSSILFELKAAKVKKTAFSGEKPLRQNTSKNQLVKIRPCGEEYQDKTYLGFYIGDLALSASMSINEDTITTAPSMYNPAIYIPELGKTVFGVESWWGRIDSVDDLEEISNKDIDNVWYVQLMKKLKKDGLGKDEV